MKFGSDVADAIRSMKEKEFTEPSEPEPKEVEGKIVQPSKFDEALFLKKVDHYHKQQSTYEDNMKKTCSLILGQCTDALKQN